MPFWDTFSTWVALALGTVFFFFSQVPKDQQEKLINAYRVAQCASGLVTLVERSHFRIMEIVFYRNQMSRFQPMVGNRFGFHIAKMRRLLYMHRPCHVCISIWNKHAIMLPLPKILTVLASYWSTLDYSNTTSVNASVSWSNFAK